MRDGSTRRRSTSPQSAAGLVDINQVHDWRRHGRLNDLRRLAEGANGLTLSHELLHALPSTLILVGRSAGSSRLEVTDADNGKESYLIIVQRDLEMLKNLVRKTIPTALVEITPIGDSGTNIIVSGYVAREEDRDVIRTLAQSLGLQVVVNTATVGGGGAACCCGLGGSVRCAQRRLGCPHARDARAACHAAHRQRGLSAQSAAALSAIGARRRLGRTRRVASARRRGRASGRSPTACVKQP